MASSKTATILSGLGFTALESEVYSFLLGESPATGYRVGQALAKPAANIYKALESLEQKGAIVAEAGNKKHVRPVPPSVLIQRIEKEFRSKSSKALKQLEKLGQPAVEGVFQPVTTPEMLLAQAQQIIRSADSVLLVMGTSAAVSECLDEIEGALERGVDVYVLTDLPMPFSGGTLVTGNIATGDASVLEIGADDRAALSSVVFGSTVQGVWAEDHAYANHLFAGLLNRMAVAMIRKTIDEDGSKKQIRSVLDSVP